MRDILNFGGAPSKITHSHVNCGKVQDSYTLRCIPQVHGITHDTIAFSYDIVNVELNRYPPALLRLTHWLICTNDMLVIVPLITQ